MEEAAFKALGPFAIVQAAVAMVIVFAGIYVLMRGSKDKPSASNGTGVVPSWTMMGPVHDVMGAVHDIAENGRQNHEQLRRIEAALGKLSDEAREQTQLLEHIRNNQEMRADPASVPQPRRR